MRRTAGGCTEQTWIGSQLKKEKNQDQFQYRIFSALRKLIELRKSTKLWADYNNTSLVYCDNQHLLAFSRFAVENQPINGQNQILILMNFDSNSQLTGQEILLRQGFDMSKGVYDLYSERPLDYSHGSIELQPYQFYFIAENPRLIQNL